MLSPINESTTSDINTLCLGQRDDARLLYSLDIFYIKKIGSSLFHVGRLD